MSTMAIAYVLKGKFVMYTYQCLVNQSYAEIADCLNLAFSDYALPIQMSAEQVEFFSHPAVLPRDYPMVPSMTIA